MADSPVAGPDEPGEGSLADEEIARWVARARTTSLENLPALSAFQRQMDQYPQLSAAAQAELHRDYLSGRRAAEALRHGGLSRAEARRANAAVERGAWAQNHLVGSNAKLVMLIARENLEDRYGRDRVHDMLPDLVAEALVALTQAVVDFDPERCPTFSTYAARRIRDHVRMMLTKEGPLRLAPSWSRLKRIAAVRIPALQTRLGRAPTREEMQADLLSACLEWAEKRLTPEQAALPMPERRAAMMDKLRKQGMLGAIRDLDDVLVATQSVTSLDSPIGDGNGSTLGDLISGGDGGVSDGIEHEELHRDLMQALAELTERERQILMHRFGFVDGTNWTYQRIADNHNVTAERIRQIERNVLARLASPHGQFNTLASHLPSQFDAAPPEDGEEDDRRRRRRKSA